MLSAGDSRAACASWRTGPETLRKSVIGRASADSFLVCGQWESDRPFHVANPTMTITIVGPDTTYRATAHPDQNFAGIDRAWTMELNLNQRPELGFEEFDHYFTSDVFDLAREMLAPIT